MSLEISVHDAADWVRLQSVWKDIEDSSSSSTFFLSVEWVSSWLETFADEVDPRILVFHRNAKPVAACIVVNRVRIRGFIPVQTIFLGTNGESPRESPWTIFSSLLCRDGLEDAVANSLAGYLSREEWDAVAAEGFCQGQALDALKRALTNTRVETQVRRNYYIDLARLRESGTPYECALGRNTRYNLKQSRKLYGDLEWREAKGLEESLAAFELLVDLHQASWKARGKPGAFASPRFVDFQRRLIEKVEPIQRLQLFRVDAAGSPIGLLYNFLYRRRVYNYQAGFSYSREHNRYRPGLVCIACCVGHCMRRGDIDEFHLFPGTDYHKRLLSTDCSDLEWVQFQRPGFKNSLVRALRAVKYQLLSIPSQEPQPALPSRDQDAKPAHS